MFGIEFRHRGDDCTFETLGMGLFESWYPAFVHSERAAAHRPPANG